MARLPRLALAGLPHLVEQRALHGQPAFADDIDRSAYRDALRETAALLGAQVHAYGLVPDRALLVVTPSRAEDLGRLMQGVGRRYVAAFNRRHGRRGTLWDGRFRAAPLEPETALLPAHVHVESLPVRLALVESAPQWDASSARHHLGLQREPWLVDAPAVWRLGNTPFEREQAYAQALAEASTSPWRERFDALAAAGWAIGSPAFVVELARRLPRPAAPRPRGRPRRAPA